MEKSKSILLKLFLNFIAVTFFYIIILLFSVYLPYGIMDSFQSFYGFIEVLMITIFLYSLVVIFSGKKRKLVLIVLYSLVYAVTLFSTIGFSASLNKFSEAKWEKYESARLLMLDDFIKKHEPEGKDIAFVKKFLGEPDFSGTLRETLPEEVADQGEYIDKKVIVYKNLRKDYKTPVAAVFFLDDYSNIYKIDTFEQKNLNLF